MSELKYKVGDRFKGNGVPKSNTHKPIIDHIKTDEIEGLYFVICEDDDFKNGYVDETWIDDYYVKIEETKEDRFTELTRNFGKMLTAKNKNYGNAAQEPLNIVGKHHELGKKVDEKLSRIKNSDTLRKNDVADTIGYLFLICDSMGWNDFNDQID